MISGQKLMKFAFKDTLIDIEIKQGTLNSHAIYVQCCIADTKYTITFSTVNVTNISADEKFDQYNKYNVYFKKNILMIEGKYKCSMINYIRYILKEHHAILVISLSSMIFAK